MNLAHPLSDWKDHKDPVGAILQVFLFAEGFNCFCARRAIADPQRLFSTSSLLLSFREHLAGRDSWPEWIELAGLLKKADRLPPYNTALLDSLTFLLLEPAIVVREPGEQWRLTGSSRLPRIPLPAKLTQNTWLISSGDATFFSTRQIPEDNSSAIGRQRGWFWDQVVDPIAICHRLLMEAFPGKKSVERTEFFLQRAFKRSFSLGPFSNEFKYLVSEITSTFNSLFYESSSSTRLEDAQGARSATVSTSLAIEKIRAVFTAANQKGYLKEKSDESDKSFFRQALGILMFARFCRVLRIRYFQVDKPDTLPDTIGTPSFMRQGLVEQCVSSVRHLEFGYFLNRVFGSISEISGLNFVFRGGILPRPETGRVFVLKGPAGSGKTVFALQKLCGVAGRGGLAVYFSFEERFDLLVDRLVTFGLLDNSRFDVILGGKDIVDELGKRPSDGRGTLVLFTVGNGSEYPLLDVIDRIGRLKFWPWRALVIDSINALQLVSREEQRGILPSLERVAARDLIEHIEKSGYLGVIISEDLGSSFDELEYVADTVMRFGFDSGDRSRWMEVKKCRSQNFHGGRHKLRFIEGEGVVVIPSLGAVRSALRRRIKSTLSRERVIPIPATLGGPIGIVEVAEKSSSLVLGHHGAGKTSLLLKLATEPTRLILRSGRRVTEDPRAVLFVSFKTTEERFLRALRLERAMYARWQRLRMAKVRWFSPGLTLTGDEVVWEIWQHIQRARRQGLSIERVIFDEIENSVIALPGVAKEPLFWTTLLQMTSAEAITTFFGLSLERSSAAGSVSDELSHVLLSEVDYVLTVSSALPALDIEGHERGWADISSTSVSYSVEKCPEEMRVEAVTTDEPEGRDDIGVVNN
ncbi:MAG TPA: ATPase domain-containing protein [Thermoanaerobaculia bacterium]|nr:ATPase domain-containing protein [Thermoanaerobaculia bacterium]